MLLIHPYAVVLLVLGMCFIFIPWVGIPLMVAGALVQARFLCARRDHQHAMSEKERDRRAAAWKSL
jgi:hypothetical protein